MQTYVTDYQYSEDGKRWYYTSTLVQAASDSDAVTQIKNKAPYVKDIKVELVR